MPKQQEKETTKDLATFTANAIVPRDFAELERFAQTIAKTDMVPKAYKDKPGDALVAMMMGYELGLPFLQALQNVACINGKPSIYGDLALALVQSKGVLESFEEFSPDKALEKGYGWCSIKRKGDKNAAEYKFSIDAAKTAKLWGKEGPWSTYPGRMLQMRARAFALRDKAADVLKGLAIVEEVQDYAVEAHVDEKTTVVRRQSETAKETVATETSGEKGRTPYFIDKVTKSAFGGSDLFKVWIGGNAYETTDKTVAEKAKKWSEEKVAVWFEDELVDGHAFLSFLEPAVQEAVTA